MTRNSYRVNGVDLYSIEFRPQPNGTFKIFVPMHPPDPHRKNSHEHHLYDSGEICVAPGKEPRTLDRAKAIAIHWMECWSVYIRTSDGKFPKGGRKVTV